MRESQRDSRLRSFAARFGQDSGRSAPCVQPKTPDGHQRENVRSARDVSPRSVQFSVAKSVQFSVAIDIQGPRRLSIFPPIDIRREGNVTAFLTKMTVELPVANDRLIPFVTGGGGVARLSERFSFGFPDRPVLARTGIRVPLVQPFDDISRAETGLALTLGGGLDVRLWGGLAVGADIRWLRLLANRDTLDSSHIAARISYRF